MLHAPRLWRGIRTVKQAEDIFNRGVEKIILNSYAVENPFFIQELADLFGSQSIVVSIDVKKNFLGNYQTYTYSGKTRAQWDPVIWAKEAERLGAGEIFLNFIDRDGKMNGYDIPLIKAVSSSVSVPVIACGGAGRVEDLSGVIHEGGASAAAAGSMFVYYGKHRAVLINFPNDEVFKSSGLH